MRRSFIGGGKHTEQSVAAMRRLTVLVAFATLAAATAGCNRSATVREPGRLVAIRVADYRYDPQNVSVRRGRITFFVTNAGREPTNFRIRRRDRELAIASVVTLPPGGYATTTVRLRRGSYTMYASVARNESLGEYGTLTVR